MSETKQVTMTAAQLAQWEAFQADRHERLALVVGREALDIAAHHRDSIFHRVAVPVDGVDAQYSHTFTNSDSSLRLTLGVNTVDGYRDTVEDGIATSVMPSGMLRHAPVFGSLRWARI